MNISFEEWIEETQGQRDTLVAYSKEKLPAGISSSDDMDRAIQNEHEVSQLLADATMYLAMETAKKTLAAKEDYPDLSAQERKKVIEGEMAQIQRLVDGISTTKVAIKNRIWAMLNQNRSR